MLGHYYGITLYVHCSICDVLQEAEAPESVLDELQCVLNAIAQQITGNALCILHLLQSDLDWLNVLVYVLYKIDCP